MRDRVPGRLPGTRSPRVIPNKRRSDVSLLLPPAADVASAVLHADEHGNARGQSTGPLRPATSGPGGAATELTLTSVRLYDSSADASCCPVPSTAVMRRPLQLRPRGVGGAGPASDGTQRISPGRSLARRAPHMRPSRSSRGRWEGASDSPAGVRKHWCFVIGLETGRGPIAGRAEAREGVGGLPTKGQRAEQCGRASRAPVWSGWE